ncbi:MAG: hypothetical protein WCA13_05825 [Terriglobales bacterium]
MSQSYYRTVWARVGQETWRWGKQQVLVILLAITTLALQIRFRLTPKDNWQLAILATTGPYIAYAIVFLFYQFVRSQHLLYAELEQQDKALQLLKEKPSLTAAEIHHYDEAKRLLLGFGGRMGIAVAVLRHLLTHGPLTYYGPGSNPAPLLPLNVGLQDALRAYRACAPTIVKCEEKYGSGEQTYSIPESMKNILGQLLYEDESLLRRD